MLDWWKKCGRRTPHIFHVGTSQCTIGAVAPVTWPPQAQVQAKADMAMVVPRVFLLADKNLIATQWLQSLLDGLSNNMNYKQTLQNLRTLTVRHCQSKDTAGAVMNQVTMEQTLYIQIRKNKETERKDWMSCEKNTYHQRNWKKSSPWQKLPPETVYKECCCW